MALIDNPREWILRMFEMEERSGRGADCQIFPHGIAPADLPLETGERVYGIYKAKYFFTPQSFLVADPSGIRRVRWDEVTSCSSKHGEGKKTSKLTLTDGSTVTVKVGDFATGWSGRISQLFHQMIDKWGARATFGPSPLSIEDFFAAARDEYCLAPNLMPHPSLEVMQRALVALRDSEGVTDVLLKVVEVEEDGTPVSDAVIVRYSDESPAIQAFAERFGADGVIDASEQIDRNLPVAEGLTTSVIVWD